MRFQIRVITIAGLLGFSAVPRTSRAQFRGFAWAKRLSKTTAKGCPRGTRAVRTGGRPKCRKVSAVAKPPVKQPVNLKRFFGATGRTWKVGGPKLNFKLKPFKRKVPVTTKRPKKRPARAPVVRRFTRRDESGKHSFSVTLQASGYVDRRALDYLARQLRVREIPAQKRSRPSMKLWRARRQPVDRSADEIAVTLAATSRGTNVSNFAWLSPSGFQMARPGVLRVDKQIAASLAGNPRARLGAARLAPALGSLRFGPMRFWNRSRSRTRRSGTVGSKTAALTHPRTLLRGSLTCNAAGGASPGALAWAQVSVETVDTANRSTTARATTDAQGNFVIAGRFGDGPVTLKVNWESSVPIQSAPSRSTRLVIMDGGHATRSNDVTVRPASLTNNTVEVGSITITSVDCQIWRYGVEVLEHFHRVVGTSPPDGQLRIKRWNENLDKVPYTYHEHIIVSPNHVQLGEYLRRAMFHEFGHSIFHVADGDIYHWQWDNFKFAYARRHTGCEIFNKQTAWNEGWANYWRLVAIPNHVHAASCPHMRWHGGACQSGPYLEWNEAQIGDRLKQLSDSVSDGPKKMVQVLLENRGKIHSLWEFEQAFCRKVGSTSRSCTARRTPCRAAPPSCPQGYTDDGGTCRITDVRSKPSYGRGVGTPPVGCRPGQDRNLALCYPRCRAGFKGVGPVCWQMCPAGYHDDGATCRRAGSIVGANNSACPLYDKCGVGAYYWKHKRRCSTCPAGYHNDGCTCRRDPHIFGKQSYGRGGGVIPKQCRPGMEYDAGLCYRTCRTGFTGVGPVCWGSCPAGLDDHGATCFKSNIIIK